MSELVLRRKRILVRFRIRQNCQAIISDNFQTLEHPPRESKLEENMKFTLENPGPKQTLPQDDTKSVINMISTSYQLLKEIAQTTGKVLFATQKLI